MNLQDIGYLKRAEVLVSLSASEAVSAYTKQTAGCAIRLTTFATSAFSAALVRPPECLP
jgi:hypothetical protein